MCLALKEGQKRISEPKRGWTHATRDFRPRYQSLWFKSTWLWCVPSKCLTDEVGDYHHFHMWRNWGIWSFCNKWQKPKCVFTLGHWKQVTEVASWTQGVEGRGERQRHTLSEFAPGKRACTTVLKLASWEDQKQYKGGKKVNEGVNDYYRIIKMTI